jgi:hypothetical protein
LHFQEEGEDMPRVTQLVLNLQSKPGVLANVCGILASAGINIEAICAAEAAAGKGRIRILVGDADKAETALKDAKIRCGREEAITVFLENRPGALAEAGRKLAQAKVNIKCAYATTSGPGQAVVVLSVSNVQKAIGALGG